MKKLLVILLLLFPVHGAWGETEKKLEPKEIKSFSGVKFGESCLGYEPVEFVKDRYKVPIKKPNKFFGSSTVYVTCTRNSKKLWEISESKLWSPKDGFSPQEGFKECMKSQVELANYYYKKYNLLFFGHYTSDSLKTHQVINELDTYNDIIIDCDKGHSNPEKPELGSLPPKMIFHIRNTKLRKQHKKELEQKEILENLE